MEKYITIALTRGYETVIDVIDSDLAQLKWQALVREGQTVYAVGAKNRRLHSIIASRMIGQPVPKTLRVDHIDGNGLNNRRENLRICTHAQNTRNQRIHKNNTSGYKGVSWRERDHVFVARIGLDYKRIHIGNYRTALDAAIAYNRAAVKYFGDFAKINPIPNWETTEIEEIIIPSDNTTGYRGISFRSKTGRYRAIYKGRELGTFATAELAYTAYLEARSKDK